MFSCKLKKNINLHQLISKIQNIPTHGCSYNEELFPALFIKPHIRKKGMPTILIFRSGSYIILGTYNINVVNIAHKFVITLLNEINK